MLFKAKPSKWYTFEDRKPEIGVIVLFSNHSNYWIGRIENYNETSERYLIFMQDENNRFQFSYIHSHPVFWRYLPNVPERKNP